MRRQLEVFEQAGVRRAHLAHVLFWRGIMWAESAWRVRQTQRKASVRWVWQFASLLGIGVTVAGLAGLISTRSATGRPAAPFLGTTNAPQVSVVVDLHDPQLHPRQLAYDAARNGLWFWTSTQDKGVTFDNRVYFYDVAQRQLRSWPIYSGDWSPQVLAGLTVAPDGNVWIGWNHNLVAFHPSDDTYTRYVLPDKPQYPLPSAVLGDLPADLGIADLAVASDGTVWIARYGALSLTSFSPTNQEFHEHPLPPTAGDPASLALGPDGQVFFTIDLSADHPGHSFERIGEYDPRTGAASIYAQPARALAVTSQGDLYTTIDGHGYGLARLSATERASAQTQHRDAVFTRRVVPFDTDGSALAVDVHGRVWMAVGGKPDMAALDPSTGQSQLFQYAAPSIVANPVHTLMGLPVSTPAPSAVWLTHIAAMVTDSQGYLWYIRAGYDQIEEVAA